tara:strand:- start:1876 stop:2064 length:189 start_codon:yes stop_codon:yes gene_type:complete
MDGPSGQRHKLLPVRHGESRDGLAAVGVAFQMLEIEARTANRDAHDTRLGINGRQKTAASDL